MPMLRGNLGPLFGHTLKESWFTSFCLLRVRGSIASSVTSTGRGSAAAATAAATAGTAAQLDEGLHANLSATSEGAQNGDLT